MSGSVLGGQVTEKPLATTDPIFPSREVAEQKIIEMFEEWMSEMGP